MNIKEIKKLGIKGIKFFSKGKRGIIYTGYLNGKKIAIKTKRKTSLAKNRIENELNFLKKLNKYKIGPKVIKGDKRYLIYELVDGDFILDFIEKSDRKKIISVIKNILKQCYALDKLKINKLEMHRPLKHIIVGKKPVLIDFERCYCTKNPKNVTQFCQFLMSISPLLKKKGIKMNRKKLIYSLKKYKKEYFINAFKGILRLILWVRKV